MTTSKYIIYFQEIKVKLSRLWSSTCGTFTDAHLKCSKKASDCRSETLSRYFAWSARIARVSSCSAFAFICHWQRLAWTSRLIRLRKHSFTTLIHIWNKKIKRISEDILLILAPQTGLDSRPAGLGHSRLWSSTGASFTTAPTSRPVFSHLYKKI